MERHDRTDDAFTALLIVFGGVAAILVGFGLIYSVYALIVDGVLLPPLVALILLTVTIGPVFLCLRLSHRDTNQKAP